MTPIHFSTPEELRLITEPFELFCAQHSITILSRCVVRHWCWEWSGWSRDRINHYLTILVTEQDARSNNFYSLEFWAEADNNRRFARRLLLRKRFALHDFADEYFLPIISEALSATWTTAQQLTTETLNHSYESHHVEQGSLRTPARDLRRILVVDDSLDTRELLKQRFEALGYSVKLAQDEFEALEMVERVEPDVVILDLMMPLMSGPELIDEIRGLQGSETLPVIVISSEGPGSYGTEGLVHSYAYYLRKSNNPQDLLKGVSGILSLLFGEV
jgi:CheY-like chemotaxis protein